jgi:thiamine monophosphate kinase
MHLLPPLDVRRGASVRFTVAPSRRLPRQHLVPGDALLVSSLLGLAAFAKTCYQSKLLSR